MFNGSDSSKRVDRTIKIIKRDEGGKKGAVSQEKVTIDFAFASVCLIKDIKKGDSFSKENLWLKRPGTGDFNSDDYYSILGKVSTCDIKNGEQLQRHHVQGIEE